MKKIFSFILILTILATNFSMVNAMAEPLKGSVVENDQYKKIEDELFTGKVESLNRKDIINMTVSQVLDSSFSVEGDEFFAEVTSDVVGDKGVVIPKGTVAHGVIKDSGEAKRLGRDGYMDLSFDYIDRYIRYYK